MHFNRVIDFSNTLKRKSFFLFGPRQTGKSTLLKSRFPEAYFFDLLDPTEFLRFTSDPSNFGKDIEFLYTSKNQKLFIVDEIQSIPILLDEVHRQIELRKDVRFILTASSARKLRKSGVNLLGGRASKFEVDFLIQHSPKEFSAIEVKSSTYPGRNDYKGILALGEELKLLNKIVVCMCDRPYAEQEGIKVLPLIYFLEKLWDGEIF